MPCRNPLDGDPADEAARGDDSVDDRGRVELTEACRTLGWQPGDTRVTSLAHGSSPWPHAAPATGGRTRG